MTIRKSTILLLAFFMLMGVFMPAMSTITAYADTISRHSYVLGNDPNVIIKGGVMHNDGFSANSGGIYKNAFSSDANSPVEKISDVANARNLNYLNGILYFTTLNEAECKTRIIQIASSNTKPYSLDEHMVTEVRGNIKQMYAVHEGNSNYLLFNVNGSIFRYNTDTGTSDTVYSGLLNDGFFPTALGLLLYNKTELGYELRARKNGNNILIADNVSTFSLDSYSGNGELLIEIAGITYTVGLSSIFNGAEFTLTPRISETVDNNIDATEQVEDEINTESIDNAESEEPTRNTVYVEDIIYKHGSQPSISDGQKNIIKRAKQLQAIKWYCKKTFTLNDWTFVAGNYYHGVPYGQRPNDTSKYVGDWSGATSLSAFYTATTNDSFYSTTGVRVADCSSFVSYAWGLSSRKTTSSLPNVSTYIGSFSSSNAASTLANLQIGDCLDVPGSHCMLVASLQYDDNGNLVQIVTFEQRNWTASSKRNICVYDSSVSLISGSTWSTYEDYSRYGKAMPLEAFLMRMQQEKSSVYKAYRSNTRDNTTYTYYNRAVVGLNTPSVTVSSSDLSFTTLSWSAITNAQDYDIAFSQSNSNDCANISNITATAGTNTYSTTLLKGYYRVRAHYYDNAGPNEYVRNIYSNYCSAKNVDNRSKAPSNVAFSNNGNGSITLSWSAPSASTSSSNRYYIYTSSSQSGTYSVLASTENNTYTHTPANGPTYYKIFVRVSGVDAPPIFAAVYKNGTNMMPLGDFTGDGQVNTGDSTAVLQYVSGLNSSITTVQSFAGDVNFDGSINAGDSTAIQQYCAGTNTLPTLSAMNNILLMSSSNRSSSMLNEQNNTPVVNSFCPNFYLEYQPNENGAIHCEIFTGLNDFQMNAFQFNVVPNFEFSSITNLDVNLDSGMLHHSENENGIKIVYSDTETHEITQGTLLLSFDINVANDNGIQLSSITVDDIIAFA